MNTIKPEPIPKFSWWDLIKAFYYLLDTKRKSYLFYTFILILVLFYDLVPTYLIGRIVDFFSNYNIGEPLTVFYNLTLFLSISWGIVSLIRLSIKKRLGIIRAETAYLTRTKGFEKLLDFSLNWHDKENTGNKIEKIKSGVESLKQIQLLLSGEIFGYITGIIGVLSAFIFIKPILFFYSIAFIIIFLIVQFSFYNKMVEMNNANNALQEKAGGSYYEGLSNILTIKTMGVKDDFKKNIVSKETQTRNHSIEMVHVGNNKWKVFQIINALALGGMLYITGQSFLAGFISLGSIFIIYNYFQKLNGAVYQSTESFERLISARSGIARMMPIFMDKSKNENYRKNFPTEWDNITLENANFKYKNNSHDKEETSITESGLQNINLKIDKFSKVGLVGKSGSGKSTIAKILIGLYEIESGSYKIGINNFYQIKHDDVTKQIALVLQDSEMFNLSLKENITLMRPFDVALFEKAISISQLKPVIEKLPEGIETLIGEKGYRLSGGERQRIGIARAVYKDPQILVLDEATSSLDSNTEALIQKAFEENLEKKTVISIAHRISTLKNVNKIFVFEHGQIVEEGSFQELSQNRDSKFYEIYEGQNEGE